MLSYEELDKILSYDPNTGEFTWKVDRKGGAYAGDKAGYYSQGYIKVCVFGKAQLAHRLAWVLHYKEEPPKVIDHINGDPLDNRVINLRASSHKQNMQNRKKHSNGKSKYKGVSWSKASGKWQAQIQKRHIGLFLTQEEAAEAYNKEATKVFGLYSRLNTV